MAQVQAWIDDANSYRAEVARTLAEERDLEARQRAELEAEADRLWPLARQYFDGCSAAEFETG